MKRFFQTVSLLLIIAVVFSGCGVFSQKKDDGGESEISSEPYSESDSNGLLPVNNIEEATRPEEPSTAPATEGATKAPTTKPSSGKSESTTSPAAPATTLPETTSADGPDLSNLSVKEIQDMLFNTTDPNVAGKILTVAGFEYDAEQGIYYSRLDPLQRFFGFNVIYDIAAPRTGMIYSTKRIFFDYDGKNWMIQIWKGQYGITAGAEIGLYNKPEDRLVPQYDCAKDDELITMAFDFYNAGKYEFSRGPEEHWWLTGFKILQLGVGPLIDLDITLEFPNRKMANAFEKGLKNAISLDLVDRMTYTRSGKTFSIEW